ncbi:hypothetical protein QEN19_003041 [Hanseniaspora menglaensis]
MSDNESISSEKSTENFKSYKVGTKKTLNEYANIDSQDESLIKWKKSLGLTIDDSDLLPLDFPDDKRSVVVLKFQLYNADTKTLISEISFPKYRNSADVNAFLKNNYSPSSSSGEQIKIKEKTNFSIKIIFKVQNDLVTGLKYKQSIKKAGITLDKVDNQIGSYAPNSKTKSSYDITLDVIEAPSGLLGRGNYSISSKFIDDDKKTHLELNWSVNICK